jgi:hypothetical protein
MKETSRWPKNEIMIVVRDSIIFKNNQVKFEGKLTKTWIINIKPG